jgi:SAM-dependent methyltransferase
VLLSVNPHYDDPLTTIEEDLIKQRTIACGCGEHGSCLIDRCFCDPGSAGRFCNRTLAPRNAKCRFDPNQDICWNLPGVGRFRVASRERQQQAFSCETKFWETTAIPKRNQDQLLVFEHFRSLPSDLGDVLEIGAGPYTKVKLILESRHLSLSSVTLVDPLMEEYRSNPRIQTRYGSGSLEVNGYDSIPTKLMSKVGEDAVVPSSYDTVILVNTLEHCFNAVQVLTNVHSALKPGGILIFAESFAREMDLLQSDPCHPIQLQQSFFMDYLNTFFLGDTLLQPRTGTSVGGVQHGGVKRSLFAIVRKK